MSLVPCKDDPNRAAELKRLKVDPKSFGTLNNIKRPSDWVPNQLVIKETKKVGKK